MGSIIVAVPPYSRDVGGAKRKGSVKWVQLWKTTTGWGNTWRWDNMGNRVIKKRRFLEELFY